MTLEDVLDVRAHSEECVRRIANFLPKILGPTPGWLWANISFLVPDFLLRDERNQKIWADVLSSHIAVCPEDLLAAYRAYVRSVDDADDEFTRRPLRAEVWWRRFPRADAAGYRASYSEPAVLAGDCAALIEGGAHEAWFHVYGLGRAIRGDATGWRKVCRCGYWLCPWHGEPVPNQPEWHDIYDPRLWPWVGVVPGSDWQSVGQEGGTKCSISATHSHSAC